MTLTVDWRDRDLHEGIIDGYNEDLTSILDLVTRDVAGDVGC